MNQDWERQWILVCLGVVSLATIALAAGLAVVDVDDFDYVANDPADLLAKFIRILVLLGAGFCYLAAVILAFPAISIRTMSSRSEV